MTCQWPNLRSLPGPNRYFNSTAFTALPILQAPLYLSGELLVLVGQTVYQLQAADGTIRKYAYAADNSVFEFLPGLGATPAMAFGSSLGGWAPLSSAPSLMFVIRWVGGPPFHLHPVSCSSLGGRAPIPRAPTQGGWCGG